MPWFALPQPKTVTQSDKRLAKIAESASPRRHAETSPVKAKDTYLMNNKLPPAEILCGDCVVTCSWSRTHKNIGYDSYFRESVLCFGFKAGLKRSLSSEKNAPCPENGE